MSEPEVTLILARADNGVIGNEGKLPWHLPADLRHFKALTNGKPMIMGRKTFESLPGLLPGRRHIVLTRDTEWNAEGAEVTHSVEDAIALADTQKISIIGGAQIYDLFLDHADVIELTEVHFDAQGDISMEKFDPENWSETARERHEAKDGKPAYCFVTLKRRDRKNP